MFILCIVMWCCLIFILLLFVIMVGCLLLWWSRGVIMVYSFILSVLVRLVC